VRDVIHTDDIDINKDNHSYIDSSVGVFPQIGLDNMGHFCGWDGFIRDAWHNCCLGVVS
jgi:hypothetical protein